MQAISLNVFLNSSCLRAASVDTLHGDPWVFGQSVDRHDRLWKNGVKGSTLGKRQAGAKSSEKKSADTNASIDEALAQAERMKVRGKVGLSLEENSSTWAVAPEQKANRPDEEITRDKRHILRAYAGVERGDDFNISFGPELILKDEEHSAESALGDQPDSALGLGMKFKYDF